MQDTVLVKEGFFGDFDVLCPNGRCWAFFCDGGHKVLFPQQIRCRVLHHIDIIIILLRLRGRAMQR